VDEKPIIPTGHPADIFDDLESSIEDTVASRIQIAKAMVGKQQRFNPSTEDLENDLDALEKSLAQDKEAVPSSGDEVPDFFMPDEWMTDDFRKQPWDKKFPKIKKEFFRGLMKCRIEEGATTAEEMIESRQRRDPRTAELLREIAEEEKWI